jgi:hypothetical protein
MPEVASPFPDGESLCQESQVILVFEVGGRAGSLVTPPPTQEGVDCLDTKTEEDVSILADFCVMTPCSAAGGCQHVRGNCFPCF